MKKWESNLKPKILICGPLPEPTGGVSTHVMRLSSLLTRRGYYVTHCDESRINNHSFNIRSLNLKLYLKLVKAADIIHIHSSVAVLRFIHLLTAFILNKETIVTIHSWRSRKLSSKTWSRLLNLLSTKIVLVSNALTEKLSLNPLKTLIFPAFIPPYTPLNSLPEEILNFIKKARSEKRLIVCSNAFRLTSHEGEDLYGLDLIIESASNHILSQKASFIFIISDASFNQKKIEEYKKTIAAKNIESIFLLYCGTIEYYSLLQASDVSIRATNTDGDALSVRESIYLGVPCVASDCTTRPEGVQLFKNRSARSLSEVLDHTISHQPYYHPDKNSNSNSNSIENFYEKLYSREK
ncbi:hypothetical protein [Pseudomonas nicosulfuronedens]